MSRARLSQVLGVVDGIYGAAQGDLNWHVALDGLRIVLGGARACIGETRAEGFRVASHEANDDPCFSAAETMTLYGGDPLAKAEQTVPVGRPYVWREIIDFPAFRRRRLWGEFYEPMGLHDSLSCRLVDNSNASLMLHVTRQSRQEKFSRSERKVFDFIVPHLMRAGSLERTLGRTDAAMHAMAQSAAGIMILGGDCRVHWMNETTEAVVSSQGALFGLRDGTLSLAGSDQGLAMERLVAGVCAGSDPSFGGTLLLSQRGENPASAVRFVLEVAPLSERSAFGVSSARRAIVTIKAVGASQPSIEGALRSLFGLTRAEARLASLLAQDHSLRDAASRVGITFGTARNYLIRIFRKTGTDRQSALVRLASTLPSNEPDRS